MGAGGRNPLTAPKEEELPLPHLEEVPAPDPAPLGSNTGWLLPNEEQPLNEPRPSLGVEPVPGTPAPMDGAVLLDPGNPFEEEGGPADEPDFQSADEGKEEAGSDSSGGHSRSVKAPLGSPSSPAPAPKSEEDGPAA